MFLSIHNWTHVYITALHAVNSASTAEFVVFNSSPGLSYQNTNHKFRYSDSNTRTRTHAHSDAKRWPILRSDYETDFIRRAGGNNKSIFLLLTLLRNALTYRTGYCTIHSAVPNVARKRSNKGTLFAIDDTHQW